MAQQPVEAGVVEAEVERLRSIPIVELRALWRAKFKSDPPTAFGPDLLRRSIAYKIQQDAYGGLDRTTARLLKQLMEQYGKNNGRIVLPRRIKPGSVLIREWKGERHQVTVLEDGFAYLGKPYESLSQIARLITGTRWNGPKFFGLRADKE
ncbi:MAG: DUF2924 domain-containing protein [Xanthobacteraceae bacterium]